MTTSKLPLLVGAFLLALTLNLTPLTPGALQTAQAVEPEEVLDDPVLEARARDISKLLRCLVCRNQSIDDSNAGLARDLRVLVRERLVIGDTNKQTLQYVVARYGDFVLLRPPVKSHTLVLWWAPALFGLLALIAFIVVFTRGRTVHKAAAGNTADELSADEITKLKHLLKQKEAGE